MLQRAAPITIIAQTLPSGWWTIAELSALSGCRRELALHWVRVISMEVAVVRRRRRAAKWKPFEYKSFARAVNVRPA